MEKQIAEDMVYVEGGCFEMGSTDGYENIIPVHKVEVRSFYIDKYQVTQREYERVMHTNPSKFKNPAAPVERVHWHDAMAYAAKTGKRLPTEAEWEYAARGGNKSKGYKYSGGDDINTVAWHTGNSRGTIHQVGTKEPNELGIYDMSGNVWEWCNDWYDERYYSSISERRDPAGPGSGEYRVLRGGSWYDDDHCCYATYRNCHSPDYRDYGYGFRCVRYGD